MKKRQIIPQAPLSANRFFEKELENGSINQIVSRDLSVESQTVLHSIIYSGTPWP